MALMTGFAHESFGLVGEYPGTTLPCAVQSLVEMEALDFALALRAASRGLLPVSQNGRVAIPGSMGNQLLVQLRSSRNMRCMVRASNSRPDSIIIGADEARSAGLDWLGPAWPCRIARGCCSGRTELTPRQHPHPEFENWRHSDSLC